MLILLPIALLLLTALIIVLLPRLRPGFSSYWLLTVGGAFLAWVSLLIQESRIPQSTVLAVWRPLELFSSSPELLLDEKSWSLALAVGTLGLSVILVDVRQSARASSSKWAYALTLVGLGIFASFSANWLTLALAWSLIDLVVLLILWPQSQNVKSRQKVLIGLSGNLIAVVLLLAGIIISDSTQMGGRGFVPNSSIAIPLFMLAVGIRLGITIVENEVVSLDNRNWNLQPLFLFVPAAATLVLIVRIYPVAQFQEYAPYAAAISLAAAIYGAFRWVRSRGAPNGIPYWIIATGFLALAAVLLGYPKSALALGLVLIYVGSFISVASLNSRRTIPLAVLALFSFSTLPFAPSYPSKEIYSSSPIFLVIPLILIHSLLLFGYLRHFLEMKKKAIGVGHWVEVIYFLGMAWLPLTHIALTRNVLLVGNSQSGTALWWPAAAGIGVAAIFILLSWRGIGIPEILLSLIETIFSFRWIIRLFEWVARALGRLIELITAVLEGEGGVLWALLLVALLASLLIQIQAGG
jgi:hypothetical protein